MKKSLILILFILLISFSSCKKIENVNNQYGLYRQDFYGYLDTDSFVVVEYDKNKTTLEEVKKDLNKINDILFNIEILFSKEQTVMMQIKNVNESLTMRINKNSGIAPVEVTDEYITVLKEAINISNLTLGGFDVTVGPLSTLWNIPSRSEYCNMMGTTDCKIPTDEEILNTLKLVNYHKIIINETEKTVMLPEANMALDFGAIAKGYAADKVLEHLEKESYSYISINLGGNVIVSGKSYLYNQYTTTSDVVPVGIENPYYSKFNSNTVMNINETNITVVASGVSKRYIEVFDQELLEYVRYHHIISPITGKPYDNEIETISIINDSSMVADGMSTGLFSLGLDGAINYLNKNNMKGIIITKDFKIYIVGNINYTLKDGVDKVYNIINQ